MEFNEHMDNLKQAAEREQDQHAEYERAFWAADSVMDRLAHQQPDALCKGRYMGPCESILDEEGEGAGAEDETSYDHRYLGNVYEQSPFVRLDNGHEVAIRRTWEERKEGIIFRHVSRTLKAYELIAKVGDSQVDTYAQLIVSGQQIVRPHEVASPGSIGADKEVADLFEEAANKNRIT